MKDVREYRCWSCDEMPIVSGEELKHCRSLRHEIKPEPKNILENLKIDEEQTKENNKNLALKILEFAESQIRKKIVASNDSSRVYALLPVNYHLEATELTSKRAVGWLKVSYFNSTNEIHSEQFYTDTLSMIKQKSFFDETIPREIIHKRIALTDTQIFYDLCSADWKLVKITENSISIISHDENTPLFERSKNQAKQIDPNFNFQGNPLEKFCQLVRMNDELFKIHLMSMFIENIPIPVMALIGLQGSIKSTIGALVKRVVDPAGEMIEDNLSHLSGKIDDLSIHFSNNYLASFDNVSSISDEMSDNLCKTITGAGYTKRKLYTDQEEVILKFKRKIVINGISVNIDNGDLSERTIQYFTQGIPKSERKSSKQVEKEFSNLLPDLLGHIFVTLKKALSIHEQAIADADNLPRMADFVIWGEAISLALGNPKGKFQELYKKSIEKGNEILNEGNPLVHLFEEELDTRNELLYPAKDFFRRLQKFAEENHYDTKSEYFPKGANKLRPYLERNKPLLKENGFWVEIFKNTEKNSFTKNSTLIKLQRLSSPSSPSSPIDSFFNKPSDDGEHGDHQISELPDNEGEDNEL